jgi:predicted ATPase
MLEFIRIQRFKCLSDASFPLSALNLLSGLNGMGKSSLVQTLLLLRQSQERNALFDKGLLLKGDYVNIGTGQDILSEQAENETVEFLLKWENMEPANFVFEYSSQSDLQPIQGKALNIQPDKISLFNKNFQYLSADRISPKAAYEASLYYIKDLNSLGNHGEYTAHYIAEYGLDPLPIRSFRHERSSSMNLLDNLDKWMSEISPGIRIHAELQAAINLITLSYSFEQVKEVKEVTAKFKPQNVGFGLTFVLPVIVAILKSKPGDMLIIENPEAHLHPGGQTVLGRLCSIAASSGVQLFIETHSDHFLNGIRISVKEGLIESDQVKLFFLERKTSGQHEASVMMPEIHRNGRISIWPKGFFDEADRQLDKLL